MSRNISLKLISLLIPIIIAWMTMVVINECMRAFTPAPVNQIRYGAIFSNEYFPDKCSWACHKSTIRCREHHHSGVPAGVREAMLPFYDAIKKALQKGPGGYVVTNIIFLVVLWPLLISMMLMKVYWNYKLIKSLT